MTNWERGLHASSLSQTHTRLTNGSVYVSIESEEQTLPYVIQIIGEDHIFFASDYPLERSRPEFLADIPEFSAREEISVSAKLKCLAENAMRFYNLS